MINRKNLERKHLKPLDAEFSALINKAYGMQAMQKLLNEYQFESVLDLGSGEGIHSELFKKHAKEVTSLDYGESVYFKNSPSGANIVADYMDVNFEQQFDCIWCSHVLEHQLNPNLFLKKIFSDLKEGGVLALTVPPLKHAIVGGHVSLWNGGLLLYHLVHAGFNCKDASLLHYSYNVSCIVRKKTISEMPKLSFDNGDIDLLANYLPDGLSEGFDGEIFELNWYKS